MTPVITVALVGLTCLVVVLLLVVAGLLCKVRRWRKKPTIRRRVVVSHRSDLEANPSTVCEMIDIENCCNMNVCETVRNNLSICTTINVFLSLTRRLC